MELITETNEKSKRLDHADAGRIFGSKQGFPSISLAEFKRLPLQERKALVKANRILSTDTYNRTMAHLAESEIGTDRSQASLLADDAAIYTLQLRRAPHGFLIACGVEEVAQRFAQITITTEEIDFAKEAYQASAVPFFEEPMWRAIVREHNGKLPFTIRGARDGTVLAAGDPILTVSGPSELIAHFEHYFHRVFYMTLVAPQAKALQDAVGDPKRFIEVGLRGTVTDEQHLQALHAMQVGGNFGYTSNDAGAIALGLTSVGTIGHRYVQRFSSEEEAFRNAIELLPRVSLLVDLIDSYRGIDISLRLKEEYRETNKTILVRLDSGDLLDQARYYLERAIAKGFTDPKRDIITIEGMDSIAEIREIEAGLKSQFGADLVSSLVVYGAGSLLVTDKVSRADASTGFKLAAYTDRKTGKLVPTMKFSNTPAKRSIPGCPELAQKGNRRIIQQRGEGYSSLFDTLYQNGEVAPLSTGQEICERVAMQWAQLNVKVGVPLEATPRSTVTMEFEQAVMRRYQSA